MNYWIIKSEPDAYSWDTFVKDGKTFWNGIRNYQARNNMLAMKKGDLALFYHSGTERRVMGIAKVVKEAYPDHTADDPQWIMVDIEMVKPVRKNVDLKTIKEVPELQQTRLVKQGRLSVSPLTKKQYDLILALTR